MSQGEGSRIPRPACSQPRWR